LPPDTIDPASLDAFIDSLLEAGFEPVGDGRSWIGPIHPALAPLTSASTMRVTVRDGWPFYHPALTVPGLPLGRHRNFDGDICLWDVGDSSLEWRTWDGIAHRIEQWATGAQGHATEDDPSLDPDRTFRGASRGLATIDLIGREIRDFDARPIRAKAEKWGIAIGDGELVGRWYDRDRPKAPPQTLDDLRAQLRARQRVDLDEHLKTVGEQGGLAFLVFAWNTPVGPNLLVVGLDRGGDGTIEARAYQAARTDAEVRRLRSGRDADALVSKSVLVLGAGAIGSHAARLLARSGLGSLRLVDSDRVRPGDIVRHGADGLFIGWTKVSALELLIGLDAPWTTVEATEWTTWQPKRLAAMIQKADLVVDAVGSVGFTAQLSRLCRASERAMVSVALYRRGAVGRVRIQSKTSEIEILDRGRDGRFTVIPPAAIEEDIAWEAGCGAPVAEAPPTSVASVAAMATREAINVLGGREVGDLDVIECYEPFDAEPFDTPGVLRCRT
jgi:hypothetical protein